ncbi:MAG TPA: acyl-CoA reductase, partial [Thermoanaerobaculia bacterium]|nr:acyl-CoA reductase [Thermoanaerobaculia bacterium]
PALARLCNLSPQGLAAGLEAVLGGVRRGPATALLARARSVGPPAVDGPVLVVLAANLPALAVQPLLPALALRRPVLLKSPSAEPLFAPAFVAALAAREPRLERAVAALTWRGGEAEIEAPLLAGARTILAYGEHAMIEDLERRAPGKVLGYGPKISLAAVGSGAALERAAEGLARDVALFDQRGCLSIAAVYTTGDALELARLLAEALARLARQWPPGPLDAAAVAVQQVRLEAEMRGLAPPGLAARPLAQGTVIVEPEPTLQPSPGLRTVRIHPLADFARLPAILAPWRGRLQGVAMAGIAGEEARQLAAGLTALGVSRLAEPGELQSPDASWHNGGIDPLAALAGIAELTV